MLLSNVGMSLFVSIATLWLVNYLWLSKQKIATTWAVLFAKYYIYAQINHLKLSRVVVNNLSIITSLVVLNLY